MKRRDCFIIAGLGFLLLALFVPQGRAEEVLAKDNGPLRLNLSKGEGGYLFVLKEKKGKPLAVLAKAQIFLVENPFRLVIDLPQALPKLSSRFTVSTSLISAIRFASYQKKTRIVLDLSVSKPPHYKVETRSEKEGIRIRLSSEEKALDLAKDTLPTQSAAAAAKKTADPQRLPTPVVEVPPPAPVSSSAEASAVSALLSATPAESLGAGLVKAILFTAPLEAKKAMLLVRVEGVDSYQLEREAGDRFRLQIDNAHLATEALRLLQFPPENFEGIQVVRARNDGRNVIVEIVVDEGAKLVPFRKEGELWVKVAE